VAEVPVHLRIFDDLGSAAAPDRALQGVSVYPDRAAWLYARREWEAEHRITVEDWFTDVGEDAGRRFGLQGMNEAFSRYFCEGDYDEDPRLTAPSHCA
jgi:hypothetical protein